MNDLDSISHFELFELVCIGCFGSIAIEVVTLINHIISNKIPSFYKSKLYWCLRILLVITAGGLVYVYVRSGIMINPIIALNIGASAPLLIEKFSKESQVVFNTDN